MSMVPLAIASTTAAALGAVLAAVATVVSAIVASLRQARVAESQRDAMITAADKQRDAAIRVAAENRFAQWQLRKREVYAEFLGVAGAASESPDAAQMTAYATHLARAMLVANREAREFLRTVQRPQDLADAGRWEELVERLGDDARTVKRAD